MIVLFLVIFCAIVALGFGGAAAWSDYSRMIIPNMYVACIGAAFVPAFLAATLMAPDVSFFSSWKSHLLAAGIVFGGTYALFHFKIIGGGDSKMLSVFALWTGFGGLMPLLFYMAVIGGLLGLTTLGLNKWKPIEAAPKDSWLDKAQTGVQDVPYGIAIFVGALVAFYQVGYLQPETLIELAQAGMGS